MSITTADSGLAVPRRTVVPTDALFTDGFVDRPFWHDAAPPRRFDGADPPREADVVVIGSGYTGLHAALQTARAGRSTVVLEAGAPGHGCSTRNGGQISASVKPSQSALMRRHGDARGRALREEGRRALHWIGDFVAGEGIDCDFRRNGRFHAAHTPRHYEELARNAEAIARTEGLAAFAVPRAEQHSEIGSDFYYGGVVNPDYANLHPAKYHSGLLDRVIEAGATVIPHCAAVSVTRDGDRVSVGTERGTIRARDVVVATNGYSGGLVPWLQRRVIPIGSYMIATEEMPPETVARLFPKTRIVCDTRTVVYYYGPSTDGRRVVFGGRVSAGETDPRVSGPRLHADMRAIFPELAQVRISHAWSGTVAYTFDELAHCGVRDGVHYAMGYCGSGVSMASWFGMKAGLRIAGDPDGQTAFDDLPFPTRPFYTGRPWFLPAAVAWYRWRDRRDRRHLAQPGAARELDTAG